MSVVAVIVAGGRRAGTPHGEDPDDGLDGLTPVAGVSMVVRSVRLLMDSGRVDRLLLVVPDGQRSAVADLCDGMPVDVRGPGVALTHGWHPSDVVLVHDAGRPLTPPSLVGAVLDAIRDGHDVAVPVLALTDTVKLVDGDGLLHGAPDRSGLRAVQTPQAFRPGLLDPAAAPDLDVAMALAATGVVVHTVPGDALAFAVRTAWDLELAELLVEGNG